MAMISFFRSSAPTFIAITNLNACG
jgi:hypothetical protein